MSFYEVKFDIIVGNGLVLSYFIAEIM